jgi:DNA processing protein
VVSGDSETLRHWLALTCSPGVGPRTLKRLIAHFGDPELVLAADAAALSAAGARPSAIAGIRAPRMDLAEQALEWAQGDQTHILVSTDPRYPAGLGEQVDAPPVLFVRGSLDALCDPQLAVVGSRNPTPGAADTTRELARHLAACGLTITSGLALGIDAAAHEGALLGGRTIAVMGTGPDRIYPAVHRDLARRIVDQGALVTEFPPGTGPRGENFPRRNRIISALSVGTLVTEAAPRSGSLITARYAAEQGREVFAVPGSIHNPQARGCHALIKEGAKLVETARDVLEELAPVLRSYALPTASPESGLPILAGGESTVPDRKLDDDYAKLLDAMGHDPVTTDVLIRRTGMGANGVSSMLLLLELEGYVSSYPGGRYCRARNRE